MPEAKKGPGNGILQEILQEILQDMKELLIRGQHFVPPNSEQLRDPGRSWNICEMEQELEQLEQLDQEIEHLNMTEDDLG